jgi:hypothetical protein
MDENAMSDDENAALEHVRQYTGDPTFGDAAWQARWHDIVVHKDTGRGEGAGRLTPIALPRLRDRTARFVESPAELVGKYPEYAGEFTDIARGLRAAELYWVTGDMAALAMGAGEQLDEIGWAEERPNTFGLALFAGGIGQVALPGNNTVGRVPLPVDAVSWGPASDGLRVSFWTARWRLRDDGTGFAGDVPPLLMCSGFRMREHSMPVQEIPEMYRPVARTLAATWALMQQPTISERTEVPLGKKQARAYVRAGRPPSPVQIVDLRTLYHQPREDDGDGTGRTYRHRWVVRGHWRQQAHGAGWSERRRIWVPVYVKGPDGAPLLERERVNVWRR